MDYPDIFSATARASIEADLILAQRAHADRKNSWNANRPFPERESITTCILAVFLTYARQAIHIGKSWRWSADEVRRQASEGLRLLTIEISEKFGHRSYTEASSGDLTQPALREFEETPQWRQFEDEFYSFASRQAQRSATELHLISLARLPTGTGNPLLDELAAAQAAALADLPEKPLSEGAQKVLALPQLKAIGKTSTVKDRVAVEDVNSVVAHKVSEVRPAASKQGFFQPVTPSAHFSAKAGLIPTEGAAIDFATELGRRDALAAYRERWTCSEASVARAATVDPADMSRWKKGLLPDASDKKKRIETTLKENKPPIPAASQDLDA